METHTCDIELSSEQLTAIYRGSARFVQARARDGRQIRFPAAALQRFVTHSGVHGTFAITVSADQRLQRVQRCQ